MEQLSDAWKFAWKTVCNLHILLSHRLYKNIDINKGTVVHCNCINNANCISCWYEQICNATLVCFQTQNTLGNWSGDLKFIQSSKHQITKETLLHFLSECTKWSVKLLLWHIFFQPETCCDVLTYQCIVFLPDMLPYFDKNNPLPESKILRYNLSVQWPWFRIYSMHGEL